MPSAHLAAPVSHGIPRRGYVLSTAVESIAKPFRGAAAQLHSAFQNNSDERQAAKFSQKAENEESNAWTVLSIWLAWKLSEGRSGQYELLEAQEWFYGSQVYENESAKWTFLSLQLSNQLTAISEQGGIRELLPYILEGYGPGSRLSVRRDPKTEYARKTKKDTGTFYTPPDVADYMVTELAENIHSFPKILDPAVGTGVFLRAALKKLRDRWSSRTAFDIATESLHGCDIDRRALDGAAFVLLVDILSDARNDEVLPSHIWETIRNNLVECDALTIDQDGHASPNRVSIQKLFPSVPRGFDIIIGNPPYAEIGARSDMEEIGNVFSTIGGKARPTDNLYPMFLEQMIRLSSRKASGTMVLPLSIACNSGRQFRAMRDVIVQSGGAWRFAFFDRQPHALFGEDVKTRNAIFFWQKEEPELSIAVGPLRRWRSDDREAMFEQIGFTSVPANVANAIPKLHGDLQVRVFRKLQNIEETLDGWVEEKGRIAIGQMPDGAASDVYVSPTAYNFLGVARPLPLVTKRGEQLSASPLHRFQFNDEDIAAAAYAILASNFTFWWWHILGDGFHVGKKQLLSLPAGPALRQSNIATQLARLGHELWSVVRANPVRSVNRGRVSYAFSAAPAQELVGQIDHFLVAALGLPEEFTGELSTFSRTIRDAQLFAPETINTTEEAPVVQAKVSPEVKEKSRLTKEEWREYTKTVWSIANKARPDHPAAFPEEIPHRLTKLFSFYGETVLDPFAGTGSTARAAIPLGRRAVCVEQNGDYADIIRSECAKLRNGHADNFVPLEVMNSDSRDMSGIDDDSVGLVVTSPPYWDKADYGAGEQNLGNIANYNEFLESIKPVFRECYRVLAPGRKMCIVTANVNQHTEEGLLTFPLATDFAVLLRNMGFVMVNEVIWSKDKTGGKWGSFGAQRPIFGSYPYPPNFLFKNIHEYILIFAKPGLAKRKGPKVRKYSDLMAGLESVPPFSPADLMMNEQQAES